jgi:hypothetical protein
MRPIITTLFMMRIMVAALVLVVVVFINFTWIFTVPACITSGSGAPGQSASANSQEAGGAFGCWLQPAAKEQARQQAFDEWARESERIDIENRERLDRERRDHHR